jgi:ribosomal protein L15E
VRTQDKGDNILPNATTRDNVHVRVVHHARPERERAALGIAKPGLACENVSVGKGIFATQKPVKRNRKPRKE